MANERTITAHFCKDKRYFENSIGAEFRYTAFTGPYEYLLGALAGCFFATLDSFERKRGWEKVSITVRGIKREEVPTTLRNTYMDIEAYGIEDREEFEELVKKAQDACSIYRTISEVSDISVDITYKE